jgi:hypothetical protein
MIIKHQVMLHINASADLWFDQGDYPTVDDATKMIKGITLRELVDKVTVCDIHPYAFIEHQYTSTEEERQAAREEFQLKEFGTTPEMMKDAIETSRKG